MWWNKRNSKFPSFENDCTNFISQCLLAGGLQQERSNYKHQGWWVSENKQSWSFSWSVSNSLRWYLLSSKRGVQTSNPEELQIGDIIFYDFDGDGVFQHSTIVVKKVGDELYVNAHTSDSNQRHYLYTDSSAYTPSMKYSFVKINRQ